MATGTVANYGFVRNRQRGLPGLSRTVRKGYQRVRVGAQAQSDANAEELRELTMYSAVRDIVSQSPWTSNLKPTDQDTPMPV